MIDYLTYDINGIPLVFWGFMGALILAMHFMAKDAAAIANDEQDLETETVPVEQPTSGIALG